MTRNLPGNEKTSSICLVTGAAGRLGQSLLLLLENSGLEARGFSSRELDITDRKAFESALSAFPVMAVFNCAAYNNADAAEKDPEGAFTVNAEGPRILAEACGTRDIPLIHFSTDYVFDGRKGTPYAPWDRPNPLNIYGKSKLDGERNVLGSVGRHMVIRTSWVFGTCGEGKSDFVDKLLQWSRDKKLLRVAADQTSSPTFAPDLAAGALALFRRGFTGIAHVTGRGACSRYEWARAALEGAGWNGTLEKGAMAEFPSAADRPAMTALAPWPEKITSSFSMPAWEDGVRRFLKARGLTS